MENKINIAELLKDCPEGMELDCAMYNNCTFDGIDDIGYNEILVKTPSGQIRLTKEGCFTHNDKYAKCIIFPKGKTTWEGFVPPCQFKDGDIVSTKNGYFIGIIKVKNNMQVGAYCAINDIGTLAINVFYGFERLATEKEKEKLFQAIKENGYTWNEETKTLEKLPKFKVGDRIRKMGETSTYTITDVNNAHYFCGKYVICDTCDNDWELVPNKFDITTLKVFDKVLVRDSNKGMWSASIFSHTWQNKYICIGIWYNQCIPYEGNEHLLGITNDCDDFYKTWE